MKTNPNTYFPTIKRITEELFNMKTDNLKAAERHSLVPVEALEKMQQEGWASLESQKQYWIDKEAVADNATNETRLVQRLAEACKLALENPHDENTVNKLEEALAQYDASNPSKYDSTTADPKPLALDQTESATQWFDGLADTPWSLRDDGRSDGQGESFSERNA